MAHRPWMLWPFDGWGWGWFASFLLASLTKNWMYKGCSNLGLNFLCQLKLIQKFIIFLLHLVHNFVQFSNSSSNFLMTLDLVSSSSQFLKISASVASIFIFWSLLTRDCCLVLLKSLFSFLWSDPFFDFQCSNYSRTPSYCTTKFWSLSFSASADEISLSKNSTWAISNNTIS